MSQSGTWLNVLGMDPSFSNWGFAAAKYCIETKELKVLRLHIATTAKTKVKNSRVSTDDLARATVLSKAAHNWIEDAHVAFVEVPHGSQSARAMASYGVCIGVLAGLRATNHPFIQVSELEVKLATIGKKTASKDEIIKRASTLYPKLNWPTTTRKGKVSLTSQKCEHMADAIGAIEAGLLTDDFAQLLALRK